MKISVLVVFALALGTVPAGADNATEYFPTYSGTQFQALYDYAVANTLPNLTPPSTRPSITGNPQLDARIWDMAVARGYELRPVAGEGLVGADGILMQPQAAEAWQGLKAEARANGYTFVVSSGYRSVAAQRSWFLTKLAGTSDSAIEQALRWYSAPGASKHHSGYTLDFRYRDGTFGEFRKTPDYAWLAGDNFYVAKKYGFIPSYPDDVDSQGPNPEPWEFVWVGVDLIKCGAPLDLSRSRYAARYRWLAEGGVTCPGGMTVEVLDELVRRLGAKLEAMLTF